ncbi:MAG: hypothetical protein SH850_23910 [Planctomycetaceae bacterium]|nr:hypothetical protein [Planctomycetaceae bacterium]
MPTAPEVYAMLGNQSLWDVAQVCHVALTKATVPYAVVGGVAVCLRGYQRNTVDLDLLIRREDQDTVRQCLTEAGLVWSAERAEFLSPSGIPVQFLLAGDRAGKGSEVRLPDPADDRTSELCDGLPVLKLAKLIESKLACGQGNLRRTHKDYADVVELIAAHSLSRAFARFLHPSLRPAFRQLVEAARGQ